MHTSEGVELKQKELVNELEELKKKRCLETDVDGLVKSADEFAQKAEDTGKLLWITKSNSLMRTAKEKMTRKDIEDKIANVVDELKKTDFHLAVSSAQSLLREAEHPLILQCVESLKNAKYVLESPSKVLEFLVQKSVRNLVK